ncbi:MAG: Mannose-6-phosphate isomerase [Firmicutes bacterium]|nr:Mannose-6-phosphate isomerase [Bacillota bacterium]
MIDIYPLKFVPVYKDKVWGGNALKTMFGRKLPTERIGEAWELASHARGMSIVRNGVLAGRTLQELVGLYKKRLLGEMAINEQMFPFLIKIIDATDNLSIQVHPDDGFAARMEVGNGKSEAWYVLDAQENAKIIYGLKPGINKAEFIRSVKDNVLDSLCSVPVQSGDMIYVPAGTVHAIGGGMVVYEIQQNSDITYRLYDYERSDEKLRPLQVDNAIACLNFNQKLDYNFKQASLKTPFFAIERLMVNGKSEFNICDQFVVMYVIAGEGEIAWRGGEESIAKGDTILIPACLGEFTVVGSITWLKVVSSVNKS